MLHAVTVLLEYLIDCSIRECSLHTHRMLAKFGIQYWRDLLSLLLL